MREICGGVAGTGVEGFVGCRKVLLMLLLMLWFTSSRLFFPSSSWLAKLVVLLLFPMLRAFVLILPGAMGLLRVVRLRLLGLLITSFCGVINNLSRGLGVGLWSNIVARAWTRLTVG